MSETNIKEALDFATERHKGQYRKGKNHDEYITHPVAVADYVRQYFGNDEHSRLLVIVALLHDTIEDKKATSEEVSNLFGKRVTSLVEELTSDKKKQMKMGKPQYLTQKMNQMSDDAFNVKLCDRLHNILSCYEADESFKIRYIAETIFIFNHLQRKFSDIQLKIISDIELSMCNILTNNRPKIKSYL